MPIMRNPFRNKTVDPIPDADGILVRPSLESTLTRPESQPLSIRSNGQDKEPAEYKLSEINDSGVYLPPSPTEKKSFWSSRSGSSSNTHRSVTTENEAFTISRESFDSYRRSFDISARSPVLTADAQRPRQSLDARKARLPAAALPLRDNHINIPEAQPEDRFEDVGLNDEVVKPQPKKHGFLSRFGGNNSSDATTPASESGSRPSSSHHGLNVFGRKRGASGQGQELASVSRTQPGAQETSVDP